MPLDQLVLQLVDVAGTHPHTTPADDQRGAWLFPTQRPGRSLTSKRLANRLQQLGLPAEPGRCAALLDLCTQIPPAVIHQLLGISATAAERWSAGATKAAYAAEIARRF
jgi:hypothetical protein